MIQTQRRLCDKSLSQRSKNGKSNTKRIIRHYRGCDVTSMPRGATWSGLKAQMQQALPWLFWSWCYAHRLELACKSAFFSSLFTSIVEMLLRLFYIYEKSPKKSRELANVDDLRCVFEFPKGGHLPVRSHGTRWVTHKRKALQRVLDRYGWCHSALRMVDNPIHKLGCTRSQLTLSWPTCNI